MPRHSSISYVDIETNILNKRSNCALFWNLKN